MRSIFLICLFLSYSVMAGEKLCNEEQLNNLQKLESDFAKCEAPIIDSPSTAEMNNSSYDVADCSIAVAHKLFSMYYTHNQTQVTKDFDELVKAVYANSHNLIQRSDIASEFFTGTMYNTIAIDYAASTIHDIVNDYIRQVRNECEDTSF